MTKLYPHSGHYRPTDVNLRNALEFFAARNVDFKDLQVDAQQLFHKARATDEQGEKLKKMLMPEMRPAEDIYHMLTCVRFISHSSAYANILMLI